VFGPYLVYEQLGVGGMAQVHRAIGTNDAFQRSVALKRMLSHIASSEDMIKSFVREARLASYLRHENVAQTYDLGRVGDTYFIVMELITGRNLREVLRHCGVTTGPMPVQFALNILNQVCDALDYAHNLCDETGQPLGIIHRDVSPSNVIVSETGVVKLIDFGIAKASGGGMQTMSGTLKGKFAYMAPEYIAGRIDARADLFAVGVIAHELLTNRPLFSGRDDIDTLSRVRDMPIAPPSTKNPQVPSEIDDIVMTALQRDPERRWQHATALRSALTTLTKRLGLIASNAQVVQWLDWAFGQSPKTGRRAGADPDTDTDTDQTADEASISSRQETVEHRTLKQRAVDPMVEPPSLTLSSPSQKVTLIRGAGDPAPAKPTVGTPESVPAQKSAPPASNPQISNPQLSGPQISSPQLSSSHRTNPRGSSPPTSNLPVPSSPALKPPAANPPVPSSPALKPPAANPPVSSSPALKPPAPNPLGSSPPTSNAPHPNPAAMPSRPEAHGRHAVLPPRGVDPPPTAARSSSSYPARVPSTPASPPNTANNPAPPPVEHIPIAAARTIPILGAAPAFPASRARSPSAPPPQSFQAALQSLSGASSPAAFQPSHGSPAQGLPATPSSPPAAFVASPPSPPQGFGASPPSPAHGFAAPPSPQAFGASPPSAHALGTSPIPHPIPPAQAPAPNLPVHNAAPFGAPRPSVPAIPPSRTSVPAIAPPRADPDPSKATPRDSQRAALPAAPSAAPAAPSPAPATSPVVIALLVVLAAAAAAITVYFVLPLLT
jgi:serine/threonine protein kinase